MINEKIDMGKKVGLISFLFTSNHSRQYPNCYSSPWLSCATPKTDSFRHALCTVNSSSFDSADSCFTRSSPESFSTVSEFSVGASPERVVPGLRSSDRLFFEPSCSAGTWSIPEEAAKAADAPPLEGAVVVALETEDPYRDFRRSMEEMVAAHGVRDRSKLSELLVWYLRVNGEKTHGLIVRAFADLLAGVALPPRSPCSSISSKSLEMEAKEEEGMEGKEEEEGSGPS